jgi:hypothetical protein
MPRLRPDRTEKVGVLQPAPNGPPAGHTATRRRRRLPLLVKRKAAARLCGFSVPTWDRMSAAGLNPAGMKIGGSKMYRTAELVAWIRHDCPRRAEWEPLWEAIQKRGNRR